jgi:hypothetical protein
MFHLVCVYEIKNPGDVCTIRRPTNFFAIRSTQLLGLLGVKPPHSCNSFLLSAVVKTDAVAVSTFLRCAYASITCKSCIYVTYATSWSSS